MSAPGEGLGTVLSDANPGRQAGPQASLPLEPKLSHEVGHSGGGPRIGAGEEGAISLLREKEAEPWCLL